MTKREGKVAGPHKRKFLRRPLEYYWHWANVTPTIALPTRHHQLGRWAAAHSPTLRRHNFN